MACVCVFKSGLNGFLRYELLMSNHLIPFSPVNLYQAPGVYVCLVWRTLCVSYQVLEVELLCYSNSNVCYISHRMLSGRNAGIFNDETVLTPDALF